MMNPLIPSLESIPSYVLAGQAQAGPVKYCNKCFDALENGGEMRVCEVCGELNDADN